MNYRVDVQITAPVKETELEERVATAVTNLFPEADVRSHPGELIARCNTMTRFSERLREQAILETARDTFLANRDGDTFQFHLKKQAAFQGVVNFVVGNPSELGDLHVRVRVEEPDVETFIDYIAPPTEDGRPLDMDS